MSTTILLSTLNAKYHHSSFGLRYLFANLNEFQKDTKILEFTTKDHTRDIVETILSHQPKILGLGVYIWNTEQTYKLVSTLKRVSPKILIVLGGPEVSFETETQPICKLADYTIKGEADFLFYEFCKKTLEQEGAPKERWISGELPDVQKIASPYPYYSDEDIKNRVIYVEASRGCPYRCEYCLSSLDKSVRNFRLERFLKDMDDLILRGARQFKFVDRTFNLSISTSTQILQFFLDRMSYQLFLHFEMVPDRLPTELRDLICKFPAGSLQFEVGIQTWNPDVARRVSRRQNYDKITENFSFLTRETGVHLHADLIAGLPGETLESFAQGFDCVFALGSEEIQVGILKRLKGTPIIRHNQEFGMVYEENSPFQVLRTHAMSFQDLQSVNRFAQFWNAYVNSGNFKSTMELFQGECFKSKSSLFWSFFRFTEYLGYRHPQGNGVALLNLVESAWYYFTKELKLDSEQIRNCLVHDYAGKIKRDIPVFLRKFEKPKNTRKSSSLALDQSGACFPPGSSTPRRQLKHMQISK